MGISVAVVFDYLDCEYKIFCEDNLGLLITLLNRADMIVGFNIGGFDLPLIYATKPHGDRLNKNLPTYDMLEYSRLSIGWRPGNKFPTGLKLDNHLEGTFGTSFMKTENGANAPIFWKQGKYGEVINYCLGDVKREKTLFEHVWKGLPVKCVADGVQTHGSRKLPPPQPVFERFQDARNANKLP